MLLNSTLIIRNLVFFSELVDHPHWFVPPTIIKSPPPELQMLQYEKKGDVITTIAFQY